MALVGNLLSSPGRPAVCTDCRFDLFDTRERWIRIPPSCFFMRWKLRKTKPFSFPAGFIPPPWKSIRPCCLPSPFICFTGICIFPSESPIFSFFPFSYVSYCSYSGNAALPLRAALLSCNFLMLPFFYGMLDYFNMMFINGSQYILKVLMPFTFSSAASASCGKKKAPGYLFPFGNHCFSVWAVRLFQRGLYPACILSPGQSLPV